MKTVLVQSVICLLIPFLCLAASSDAPDTEYLSDAYDSLVLSASQGWGNLGRNTATVPPDGRPASALRVGEVVYEKGLGHHAPGELAFNLPEGTYTTFSALVGVHWQGGARGSVAFQVFVDDELRFDSGVMTDSDAPKPVEVSLVGARKLRLVATDAGDGISCDMANWAEARLVRDPDAPRFDPPRVLLAGQPAPEPSAEVCGLSVVAEPDGPQVALLGRKAFAACVSDAEEVSVELDLANLKVGALIEADATATCGGKALVSLALGGKSDDRVLKEGKSVRLRIEPTGPDGLLTLRTLGQSRESLVRWENVRITVNGEARPLPVVPESPREETYPPRVLPALRSAMEQLFVEWDWRMQDGIGTERKPVTYATAIERTLERGTKLLEDLASSGGSLEPQQEGWQALRTEFDSLAGRGVPNEDSRWESLWRRVHGLRREIVFANPEAQVRPLLFVKHVPSYFSHQLTQYYGRCARPGGGLFVLDAPGESMQCRELAADGLPQGSFMQPAVSYDGDRILFAYCEVPFTPTDETRETCFDRHYHLYEVRPDGTGLRQLTEGPYDDFSPCELPDGGLMFISTRRGGFHRCGRGPCNVYTLALAAPDGSNPQTVSYHETQEWDPSVLADGRVIYTRWDYVDRNAVHYQHLWTVRPDGSAPAAYFGNNTFNPVGIWEARQVPNSPLVMATAAAHHAMTAGSIILLDTTRGVDGLGPITRLTPDAPFPESETHVAPANWHAPGSPKEYVTPEEAERWPGHCYRSPWPLSEQYFLAAYSFDALIGEPAGNRANMFGLYLVDAFGNKELIYRDLNIASQWPIPLRPRPRPLALPSVRNATLANEGEVFLYDVYASDPALPRDSIKALRIVQVLPKTTPHANQPTVGFANASPGRQVLGTVPVEADGSAYFRVPARIPIAFQALDEHGRAVQTMRSITYAQPGEELSCVGCHENRLTSPPSAAGSMATKRDPSAIRPAPDGANPLSYPLLVQPVLDKNCVSCHGGDKPAGPEGAPVVLTGEPEGAYSRSYNALAKRVPYSSWGGLEENGEPLTMPGQFGARASKLMDMLLAGHHDVKLEPADMERLITWMDANALFYGTFDPEDQARQLRGERIEGPALE